MLNSIHRLHIALSHQVLDHSLIELFEPHQPSSTTIQNAVRQELTTFLFEGRRCNTEEHQLLSLSVKLSRTGIGNKTISYIEYQTSKKMTENLADKIKNQKDGNSANLENSSNQQEKFKSSTKFYDHLPKNLQSKMTPAQLKANDIATSDGASIWLSSLQWKHERFSLLNVKFLMQSY